MKNIFSVDHNRRDPLDPPKITPERAKQIAKFIEESNDPFADFVVASKRVVKEPVASKQIHEKEPKNLPEEAGFAY